ncbi:Acetyltransferase (GNAT) domain-containing protein [Chitinophaga sp. CF118]|nr:Acetyltransferase (GNAT) domain-containing protein [Chitinophaga sp. CF118]
MKLFNPGLILENDRLLLRPSQPDDLTELSKVTEPDIWKHISIKVTNTEQLKLFLQNADDEKARFQRMQFTIIDKKSGQLIGNTSFANISPENKRVEIGYT